ncbi:sulfurtransferase TusA family protein [Neobacillus drentensis]|uniref:sulfurtransferase TusA family protein n=1 Tax=Neobacillus drentensis TaxID=220684 RepID=UPI002FFDEA29
MALQYIPDFIYDAGPTGYGELILNLLISMKKLERGQIIEVISYDPGAKEDLPAWCRMQNFPLLDRKNFGNTIHYFIEKC